MRAVVTGAAGFVGSWLVQALLERGNEVLGIDRLTTTYDPALKRANIANALEHPNYEFVRDDLRTCDISSRVDGADVVYHLAAVPGVRASWDGRFRDYTENNILATQRLLEAVRATGVPRLVYASSSSVYGNAIEYPTIEDAVKRPHSPYGVSKLAGEHLCETYADAFGVHVVSLRYFTVYGPRQRPDMGIHRVIEAALGRRTFTRYGDGTQVRDMTYVDDVVTATIAAGMADVPPATTANVAGGSSVTLNDVIETVCRIVGREVPFKQGEKQAGDVRRTGGDTKIARTELGWTPRVDVEEGLERQVAWHRERSEILEKASHLA